MKGPMVFKLILIQLVAFLLNLATAKSQTLRPELVDAGRGVLSSQMSGDEFISRTQKEKTKEDFNLEERIYLEDLTKKLPLALRQKVCPNVTTGLCAGDLPDEDDWEDVPALPAATQSASSSASSSWWGRNSTCVIAAVAGAAVISVASSLKGKEIQFSRAR